MGGGFIGAGSGDWLVNMIVVHCIHSEVLKGRMAKRKRKGVLLDSYELFLHYTFQLGFVY